MPIRNNLSLFHPSNLLTLTSMSKKLIRFLLSSSLLVSSTSAASVAITDANSSFSGATLNSVTLNGATFSTSQLIQINVTAYDGALGSAGKILVQNGTGTSLSAAQRLALIETDWRGDTGFVNLGNGAGITAGFTSPVFNNPGVDFILFEINSSSPVDSFSVSFNGGSFFNLPTTTTGASWGATGAQTVSADLHTSRNPGDTADQNPTNLSELLNNPLSLGTGGATDVSQNIYGIALDFSDYGVASGAAVTTFTLRGAGTADPVIIAALPVPEPSSIVLLLGGTAIAFRRRRIA